MEILYPRCAGLDVHMDVVMACARSVVGASARHDSAEFPTTTRGLIALADWLEEHHSTHVAMEATGGLLEAGVARAGAAGSSCCGSTPRTPATSRGATAMSAMPSGSPTCWRAARSVPASCPRHRSRRCAI